MADPPIIRFKSFVIKKGDGNTVWKCLRSLGYSDKELTDNPELFVYIAHYNNILNFRNIWGKSPGDVQHEINLPLREYLNDVVTLLKGDSGANTPQNWAKVNMDRCLGP